MRPFFAIFKRYQRWFYSLPKFPPLPTRPSYVFFASLRAPAPRGRSCSRRLSTNQRRPVSNPSFAQRTIYIHIIHKLICVRNITTSMLLSTCSPVTLNPSPIKHEPEPESRQAQFAAVNIPGAMNKSRTNVVLASCSRSSPIILSAAGSLSDTQKRCTHVLAYLRKIMAGLVLDSRAQELKTKQ